MRPSRVVPLLTLLSLLTLAGCGGGESPDRTIPIAALETQLREWSADQIAGEKDPLGGAYSVASVECRDFPNDPALHLEDDVVTYQCDVSVLDSAREEAGETQYEILATPDGKWRARGDQ